MLEKYVQRQILEYLSYRHIIAWRQNTGAVKYEGKGRTRFVHFGFRGMSDIIGVLRDGRILAIEVKQEGKNPTEAQQIFIDMINNQHGVAFVAHSIEEVIENLTKANA